MDDGYDGAEDEDQLVQMVQEFIESSSDSQSSSSNDTFFNPQHHNFRPNYFALSDMVESETELEAELLECVMRHVKKMNNSHTRESNGNGVKRWLVKKLEMDGYRASLCHSCWVSSLGCPGGDYESVDVTVQNNDKQSSSSSTLRRLIVDVDFKSQFELARPTVAYQKLMEILPRVFVGDERKLEGIVSLVCAAAKQSLMDRGLHIPPWRTTAYMMSKWRRA